MIDRDWTIIIVLGIGWGATFFFNEVLLREMGPLAVSFFRVATAALFCWAWVMATGRGAWPGWPALPQLAFMGVAMFALPFAIYPLGQQYVASGVAGIVNALTPLAVVIVSNFWPGGERATLLKSFGVLAGFAGMVLLTIPAMASDQSSQLFGTLILTLAPISYAVALNYVRRFHALDSSVMLSWSFTFAAMLLLPLILVVEGAPSVRLAETRASIAFLGCVLTGASFLTAFRVMVRAGATKTSSVTFIAPISALLIGYLFLQEALSPLHFAGMGAIFLGLLLIDGRLFRRRRRRRRRAVAGAE